MFTPSAVLASGGAVAQYMSNISQALQYQIVRNDGKSTLIEFDSFLGMDFATDGKIVDNTIEEGTFATYNKTNAPKTIKVQLAIMGDNTRIADALAVLSLYQEGFEKIDLVTPTDYFEGYSLENYSYTLKHDGIGLLVVDLVLVEVKEVEPEYTNNTASKAKPISSSSAKKAGNTSTQEQGKKQPGKSVAKVGKDKIYSAMGWA